jgi:hypothetical protein
MHKHKTAANLLQVLNLGDSIAELDTLLETEYDAASMEQILGNDWKTICEDLISIGLLTERTRGGQTSFWFPFVYRKSLGLAQGKA